MCVFSVHISAFKLSVESGKLPMRLPLLGQPRPHPELPHTSHTARDTGGSCTSLSSYALDTLNCCTCDNSACVPALWVERRDKKD